MYPHFHGTSTLSQLYGAFVRFFFFIGSGIFHPVSQNSDNVHCRESTDVGSQR